MKKRSTPRLVVALGLALSLGGVGQPSRADTFVFQIDELQEGSISETLLKNGNVVFSSTQSGESQFGSFSAGIPPTTAPVNLLANILDPVTGQLSDTYVITAPANSNLFNFDFTSDTEGTPPAPLVGPMVQTITENGMFQSIGTVTLSDGSTLDLQFRSDVEAVPVPEPTTLALFGLGTLGLAGWRLRRKHT
jgi:hypothetical protein